MLIIIFLITILSSLLITMILEKFFSKKNIFIDSPTITSIHKKPTPSAGGISILISYLIFVCVLVNYVLFDYDAFLVLLSALIPIILIGLLDDYYSVSIYIRLFVQFFSSTIIIYHFQIDTNVLNFQIFSEQSIIIIFIFSIILSIWLMNLYNFMDGIDGYASSECIFVSFSASLIAYLNSPESLMYLYLAGIGAANVGFFIRNWYPAKIFMGDTGSVSIGCIFAFFIFYSASESIISIYTWLILLSVFIADASYTLAVRVVTKKNITKAHLTHAFHMLASRKNSHKYVTKLLISINLFWVLPLALLSNAYMDYHVIITILVYLPLFIYLIKIGAGLEEQGIT